MSSEFIFTPLSGKLTPMIGAWAAAACGSALGKAYVPDLQPDSITGAISLSDLELILYLSF